jgi:hypothetical protein
MWSRTSWRARFRWSWAPRAETSLEPRLAISCTWSPHGSSRELRRGRVRWGRLLLRVRTRSRRCGRPRARKRIEGVRPQRRRLVSSARLVERGPVDIEGSRLSQRFPAGNPSRRSASSLDGSGRCSVRRRSRREIFRRARDRRGEGSWQETVGRPETTGCEWEPLAKPREATVLSSEPRTEHVPISAPRPPALMQNVVEKRSIGSS